MKKRSLLDPLRPVGILRWSTLCILAGGAAGLTSCGRSSDEIVASEADAEMAAAELRLDELERQKSLLTQGVVAHNFELPGVGFYHAGVGDFFEFPHNYKRDGQWFVNGAWQEVPSLETPDASRPTAAALAKVDAALAAEQARLDADGKPVEEEARQGSGFGVGSALMMYWLLSGNRGMVAPGAGLTQASGKAAAWQRGVENQRAAVRNYAAANPGYQRLVQESRATGTPVRPGQSVRGGFGARAAGGSSLGG
jgi:hypothetical protein